MTRRTNYIPNLRQSRRRRDSRTTELDDETSQGNGTYYRCWNCGFSCNDKRDTLGDESSRDLKTQSDFMELSVQEHGPYGSSGNSEMIRGGQPSASITLDSNDRVMILVATDLAGNPIEPKHYHSTSTRGGCPFCGTGNWDGRY
jgi:hypothetical protein